MPYPAINARRMPFDIDGTEVGYRSLSGYMLSGETVLANGPESWLDTTAKGNLNKYDRSQTWSVSNLNADGFWFFFPETREISAIGFQYPAGTNNNFGYVIQGSNDSTNGMDGTWETAVFTQPTAASDGDFWRNKIFTISFSGSIKVLRIGRPGTCAQGICGIHVYGQKAAGQTPDDIIFCNSEGTEKTILMDWGDEPEGTTDNDTFYLKNVSTKQANGVNIQLNHADFVISTDQENWGSVVDITSLTAGQISAPIYVRLALDPPLLILGPRAARAIVTVTSWT